MKKNYASLKRERSLIESMMCFDDEPLKKEFNEKLLVFTQDVQ